MEGNDVPRGLLQIGTIVMGIALVIDFVWVINTALHAMK